ncbi:hypothetical protein F5Y01DRAFT_86959 [Xylaria sp. FL0043]|nr:hypothetical protein F5Y01DRAFT_86959 [Xylaria sp. FL0043]
MTQEKAIARLRDGLPIYQSCRGGCRKSGGVCAAVLVQRPRLERATHPPLLLHYHYNTTTLPHTTLLPAPHPPSPSPSPSPSHPLLLAPPVLLYLLAHAPGLKRVRRSRRRRCRRGQLSRKRVICPASQPGLAFLHPRPPLLSCLISPAHQRASRAPTPTHRSRTIVASISPFFPPVARAVAQEPSSRSSCANSSTHQLHCTAPYCCCARCRRGAFYQVESCVTAHP